jgi:hypothetical protein
VVLTRLAHVNRVFVLVLALSLCVLAACGEEEEVSGTTSAPMPSLIYVGVGIPPTHTEPILIVPTAAGQTPDRRHTTDEGIAAEREDQARGTFVGEFAGVSFVTSATDYYGLANVCGGGDIHGYAESDALTFGYLPPGTWEEGPQVATVCPDGSISSFGQGFQIAGGTLNVTHFNQHRALLSHSSLQRIKEAKIAGKPAIVVEPVTEWGFGESTVAIITDGGILAFYASFLPLDQTMKIVEGTECECLE